MKIILEDTQRNKFSMNQYIMYLDIVEEPITEIQKSNYRGPHHKTMLRIGYNIEAYLDYPDYILYKNNTIYNLTGWKHRTIPKIIDKIISSNLFNYRLLDITSNHVLNMEIIKQRGSREILTIK